MRLDDRYFGAGLKNAIRRRLVPEGGPRSGLINDSLPGRCDICGTRAGGWFLWTSERYFRVDTDECYRAAMKIVGIELIHGIGADPLAPPVEELPEPFPPPLVLPVAEGLSIDVSWWQDKSMPWFALEAAGVTGITVRMTVDSRQDERAALHVADARAVSPTWDERKWVDGYGWADPTVSIQRQLAAVVQAVETHQPETWWVDAEQYWKDWAKWWQALRGEIPKAQVPIFKPNDLSEFYRIMTQDIEQAIYPCPVGEYTGTWFVAEYAMPMLGWLNRFKTWRAHYYDRGVAGAGYVVTAERLQELARTIGRGWKLEAMKDEDRRQISSTMVLKPLPEDGAGKWSGKLDWNVGW